MSQNMIGIGLSEATAERAIAVIRRAEAAGVGAAWMTSGGPDPMMTFAAAASQTTSIRFGTAIIPTYPRHPLAVVNQTVVLDQLAPGRFRLGVGPSHKPIMEDIWGIPFEKPLDHLREYVGVLRAALTNGEVNAQGPRFKVQTRISNPPAVPIMISALRERAFRLAGEIADGAISWVCPADYLGRVAIPALEAGARAASRPTPPLVAHCFIAVHDDTEAIYEAARRSTANYPRLAFYSRMFQDAGFPEAKDGVLSERGIDSIVALGDPARVRATLQSFFDQGATELIASLIPVGSDRDASIDRCLDAIAGFR